MRQSLKRVDGKSKCVVQRQESRESDNGEDPKYGPDTEFITTWKRMLGSPASTPSSSNGRNGLEKGKGAVVPYERNAKKDEDVVPLKLISASLLELFLSSLPHDKRDNVKTVLIEMLTTGGFIPAKMFSDRYAASRNSLVNNMSAFVVNMTRQYYIDVIENPGIDNRISSTGLMPIEQITSRYDQDFEEIEQIGAGGFGKVFHAKSRVDQQHYAIKKISLRNLCGRAFQKMMDECRFHASLQHKNVVRYHNAWLEVSYAESVMGATTSRGQLEHVKTLSTTTKEPLVSNGIIFQETDDEDGVDTTEVHGVTEPETFNGMKRGFLLKQDQNGRGDSFITFAASNSGSWAVNSNSSKKAGKQLGTRASEEDSSSDESKKGLWATPQKRASTSSITFETDTNESENDCDEEQDEEEEEEDGNISDASGSSLGSNSAKKIAKQLAMDDIEDVLPNRKLLTLDFARARVPLYKTLFIQMELCHSTLEKYIWQRVKEKGPVDVKFNEEVIEGLLSAVEFLHKNNVVHRDIKPSNIMMKLLAGNKLSVLLGDFGLAREIRDLAFGGESPSPVSDEYDSKLTTGLGTRVYAAPEQLNSKDYTFSADIYSCGIVIYELYQQFSTRSERAQYLTWLRDHQKISDSFRSKWPFLCPIIEEMTRIEATLRPSAEVLLMKFRNWKSKNSQLIKAADENSKLKCSVDFWKAKYERIRHRLTKRGLDDLLSGSDEEPI